MPPGMELGLIKTITGEMGNVEVLKICVSILNMYPRSRDLFY